MHKLLLTDAPQSFLQRVWQALLGSQATPEQHQDEHQNIPMATNGALASILSEDAPEVPTSADCDEQEQRLYGERCEGDTRRSLKVLGAWVQQLAVAVAPPPAPSAHPTAHDPPPLTPPTSLLPPRRCRAEEQSGRQRAEAEAEAAVRRLGVAQEQWTEYLGQREGDTAALLARARQLAGFMQELAAGAGGDANAATAAGQAEKLVEELEVAAAEARASASQLRAEAERSRRGSAAQQVCRGEPGVGVSIWDGLVGVDWDAWSQKPCCLHPLACSPAQPHFVCCCCCCRFCHALHPHPHRRTPPATPPSASGRAGAGAAAGAKRRRRRRRAAAAQTWTKTTTVTRAGLLGGSSGRRWARPVGARPTTHSASEPSTSR